MKTSYKLKSWQTLVRNSEGDLILTLYVISPTMREAAWAGVARARALGLPGAPYCTEVRQRNRVDLVLDTVDLKVVGAEAGTVL